MIFPKTRHLLLFITAALLALPVVVASWWMVSSREPAPASSAAESIRLGEKAPSMASTEASKQEGAQPHTADAGDFQQYAATLRAQGHPEKIVRELTASSIASAFQARRTALRSQARRGDAGASDLQTQLDALAREQGALIAQVLGEEEPPAVEATVETLPGGNEKQLLMPAVMADALPATVKTEEQAANWEKVRTDFVNAIGGASQDPANPQYRKRWVPAASEADQRFRLLFGDTAFVQHQMQARNEAMLKAQELAK